MSLSRIGKRYAMAMLDMAVEKKVLDEVRKDMGQFSALCKQNKDFVSMLKSPIIPHLKKAEILKKIFAGKVDPLTLQIFTILSRKNRERVLPNVAEEFGKLYNEYKGLQEATITTTFSLDEAMRSRVKEIVKDITGKKPILTENIDPDIVGGYVLMLGDQQIDESVSGKLNDLKIQFKQKSRL